jgi:enhancing lycopene biosynthesis protein 2
MKHPEDRLRRSAALLLAAGTLAAGACSLPAMAANAPQNHLTGKVVSVSSNVMLLRTRTGKNVVVDLTEARTSGHVGILAPNVAVVVYGKALPDGTFHCVATGHAAPTAQSWVSDR